MTSPSTNLATSRHFLYVEKIDLLWGARDIAAALGRTERSVFHMLEAGALPARKIGGRWCVSRKALAAFFGEAAQ